MSPLDRRNRESAGKRVSATRIITILGLNLYREHDFFFKDEHYEYFLR